MKSGLKIRWTEEATRNLESVITYLETNWTEKELKKFFQKLEKQLLILSIFPEAYPLSLKKKKVHRCVLSMAFKGVSQFVIPRNIKKTFNASLSLRQKRFY